MQRNKQLKKARIKHIKETVKRSSSTVDAVAKLSKKLFISPSTIYRDLKSETPS